MVQTPEEKQSTPFLGKTYLKGLSEHQVQLPVSVPRTADTLKNKKSVFFSLSKKQNSQVQTVCSELRITPLVFFLSIFFLLLWKYSSQKTIFLSTPLINCSSSNSCRSCGSPGEMVPIRGDIEDSLLVDQWFEMIRDSFSQGMDHFTVGLDQIAKAAGLDSQQNLSSLLQLSYRYLPCMKHDSALPEHSLKKLLASTKQLKYELSFVVCKNGGFFGAFEYASDLFSSEVEIRKIEKHFLGALEWVCENRKVALRSMSLLNRHDKAFISTVNETENKEYLGRTFTELFRQSVQRNSNKVAVRFGSQQLTYKELDTASDVLASRLLANGVVRETRVGVCVDRGLNTLITLLAIFKSGTVYIPLDTELPPDRFRYVIENSEMEYILVDTVRKNTEILAIPTLKVISVSQSACLDSANEKFDAITVTPEQLAYVIYTSGSTGLPKGVPISHEALANFLLSASERPGMLSHDIMAVLSTTSFDFSLMELLLPLIVGASLSIAEYDIGKDGHRLSTFLEQEKITCMLATPVTWSILFVTGWKGKPDMKIGTGGEALTKQLAAKMLLTGSEIWNIYGPTECTICSSCCQVIDIDNEPSIGKPTDNTTYYILDENGNMLPPGFVGELAIGGVSLSPGYYRREELTGNAFVESPIFGVGQAVRLYKTGDLAQLTSSGDYRCFGRRDGQVKIRGFRIELGEIENTLLEHPLLTDCCCIVTGSSAGNKRIVSYYRSDVRVVPSEFHSYLKAKLPVYMIPSFFVFMEEFPKTPSQKIDRKAFPPPCSGDSIMAGMKSVESIEDAGKVILEKGKSAIRKKKVGQDKKSQSLVILDIVKEIWQESLGVQDIQPRDDFFAMGGHSLLVALIVTRISEQLGVTVPMGTLYGAPTLDGFSTVLGKLFTKNNVQSIRESFVQKDRGKWPLSPKQERLWFFHELSKNDPAYNLSLSLIVQGKIEFECLTESVRYVVKSHEAFSTIMRREEGRVIACRSSVEPDISVVRLSGKTDKQQQKSFQYSIKTENARLFDFEQATSRVVLYIFNEQKIAVVLFVPHILNDGVSFDIFHKQLDSVYHSLCTGNDISTDCKVEFQYSDYVDWLQKKQSPNNHGTTAFWEKYLRGVPAQIQLPTVSPRPSDLTSKGDTVFFSLTAELSKRVNEICKEIKITPFVFFLATFFLLLWKYSGQKTILIGAPYSDRERSEAENIIGFFVDMIPVRADINEQLSVEQWLNVVKESFVNGLGNAHIGLDKILETVDIERQHNVNPLFQVSFSYLSYLNNDNVNPDISMKQTFVNRGLSEYDLSLYLWEEEGFAGAFEYATDLFPHELVRNMEKHFLTILKWVVGNQSSCLKELSFLTKQNEQLIQIANQNQKKEYLGQTFNTLFRESLPSNLNKVAVRFNGDELTYAELNVASDILASHLLAMGAEKGRSVGVYVERGLYTLISLMAVLKSGSIYIPLDPEFPLDRLTYIVEQSGMEYLIVNEARKNDELVSVSELKVIDATKLSEANIGEQVSPGTVVVSPDQLAYMLYTSGSTGLPKGVPITHEALANFLLSVSEKPGIDHTDLVAAFTTTSFDISLLELLLPLIVGATIVIADSDTAKDPEEMSLFIEREEISYMQVTPATWTSLFLAGWNGRPGMKMLTGGEALPKQLAAKMLKVGQEVWNMYGPTECTIWSSCWQVKDVVSDPLIGNPIANTSYYILDDDGHILPPGIVGELAIGGVSLSPEYYKRPGLTGKAFVDLVLPGTEEIGRLYKTGDLARLMPSGDYSCLGRKDSQVKIRGFRIELGEIEKLLQTYPQVIDCCCAVKMYSEIDKRILAYYKADIPLNPVELMAHLETKLPGYMVPSFFVYMEEFPRTPNQKIDQNALPFPENRDTVCDSHIKIEPVGAVEIQTLLIWQEVLQNRNIGVEDNFFDLGGNSLLAVRTIQRMNDEIEQQWRLRDLFKHPTVRGVSMRCSIDDRPKLPLLFPVKNSGNKKPLFLVAGVYGDLYQNDDGEERYEKAFFRYFSNILNVLDTERPLYGLRAQGMFLEESLHTDVACMAEEYIQEIKKIDPHGPYLLAGECLGGVIAYEISQKLRQNGDDVQLLLLLDTFRPTLSFQIEFIVRSYFRILKNKFLKGEAIFQTNSNTFARKLIRYRPKRYDGKTLLIINEEWNEKTPMLNWEFKILPFVSVEVVKGDHGTRLGEYAEFTNKVLAQHLNCLQ